MATALGVAGLALIVLLSGGLYYNARLRETVKKAQAAERSAIEQRNLALNAFDHLVYDIQERLGGDATTRPARQALLKTAIEGLDQIARGTEGSTHNMSRAVAHLKLGETYAEIGLAEEARRQYTLAIRLAEQLGKGSSGGFGHRRLSPQGVRRTRRVEPLSAGRPVEARGILPARRDPG